MANNTRPKIVALTGSTKFKTQFLEIAACETLAGNIVLMYPSLFGSRTGADIDTINV